MTINKKNGKYYCRFQLNGERHHYLCSGATSIKEAEKIENAFKYKLMQQQNGVMPRDEKKISFNNICDDYDSYARTNKKSYNVTDKSYIKEFRKFFGSFSSIKEIKPLHIEDFKVYLLSTGKSQITVNRYLEALGKLFNIAIDNGKLIKSPYKSSMKFPCKNYVVRYLKQEENEEERLYKAAPKYFKDIIFLALNTGQRKSNIIYLQGKNIKLDMRIIELPENKGNKHIKIFMNDAVYTFLKKHPLKDDEYLFVNPRTNKAWNNTAFRDEWIKIKEKAGIKNLRFHDLRHTVGTRLAEKGIPVPIIQQLMAHTDISTTMRYVHTVSSQMEQAMNVLSSYN